MIYEQGRASHPEPSPHCQFSWRDRLFFFVNIASQILASVSGHCALEKSPRYHRTKLIYMSISVPQPDHYAAPRTTIALSPRETTPDAAHFVPQSLHVNRYAIDSRPMFVCMAIAAVL